MDLIRQLDVIDITPHASKRIDIVGAGAVGSTLVWLFARIGMECIHVWDFDTVATHNLPNQMFMPKHLGQSKADAIAAFVKEATGVDSVTPHNVRIEEPVEFGSFVYLAVDSMAARKAIYEQSIKNKIGINLMVETRMGGDSGRVYAIVPIQPSHQREWESTLYSDDVAEVSACGSSITVAPTVFWVAQTAVWQLIHYLNGRELDNEVLLSANPFMLYTRKFKSF